MSIREKCISLIMNNVLAPSMRSPSGITGWFARRLMRSANPVSIKHAIQKRMHLKPTDVFMELGAGDGFGLKAILEGANTGISKDTETDAPGTGETTENNKKTAINIPSRIILVEISDDFRQELQRIIDEIPKTPDGAETAEKIELHCNDCKDLPFLKDNSVDKIFGMNVVYFLHPLPQYLTEIYRVLKPGGVVVWGCKFFAVPKKNSVFINVEEEPIVRMMQAAGFEVTSEMIHIIEPEAGLDADETKGKPKIDMRNYLEVKGIKKVS